MEESIKCMLLGKETVIPMSSILNLNILITHQALKEIRLPLALSKFKPEITVLHSCIYYLIAVQKNLELSTSLSFREQCLSSLSEYYIKHKMNFELYQYGYLCGKILGIPLDRTMHIIYFLVYTRLASKPFINNIIVQMQKIKRSQSKKKTTQMLRSQKEFSLQSRSHQSRHMTIFYDSNQMETDILKKELHKIMSPNQKQSKKVTKKMENKRYFNLRKVYPDDIDLKEQEQRQREQYKSTNTSRIATVPVKVNGNDNSSVIARLKLKSNNNSKECSFKKIQVRRQRFNQWFDSAEKYEQIMSEYDTKENRKPEWGTSKNIMDKDPRNVFAAGYKSSKHPFEYYQDIASSIRNKNDQLDSIRHQCVHHNQLNLPTCLKQATSYRHLQRGSLLTKHTMKTQSCKIDPIPENIKQIQTNREVVFQNQREKDYSKISKTASVSKFGESSLQDNLGSILTRKQDVVISEDEGLMVFNKKVKNKLKLQKYKQEYRHFMKTQVFDRVSKEVQAN